MTAPVWSRGRVRRRCGGAPERPRAASGRTRRTPGARTWGSSAPAGRRREELARNPGVELFFFFQALDDLLRLIAILVASDLDLVAARRRSGGHEECRIALGNQAADDAIGGRAIAKDMNLDDPGARLGCADRPCRGRRRR